MPNDYRFHPYSISTTPPNTTSTHTTSTMDLPWQYQQSVYPIYLFTTPLKNQRKLFKKPIDVIGHWAVCINGMCYELTRASDPEKKKNKLKGNYWIRTLSLSDWKAIKEFEKRGVSEPKLVGYTARPWPHNIIKKIGMYSTKPAIYSITNNVL